MTIEQTILEIQNGNKNLYSVVMDTYYKELFHFVYNIVYNYETTEDLLQEVFMKVYKNIHKYDSRKATFRTWIYRVTNNHVINYQKSKQAQYRKNITITEHPISSFEDIERDVITDDQISQIVKIMNQVLSTKHLKIMQLHYFANMSVNEISDTLEIPTKTIYKAIKTSIEKIKKEVEA